MKRVGQREWGQGRLLRLKLYYPDKDYSPFENPTGKEETDEEILKAGEEGGLWVK